MSRRKKRGRPVHGILLLDKPTGCSSNHALQRIKRLFDAQKAGHTGSLDPLATGMLPLCFGEATKVSGYLLDADKEYIASARLGSTTNTGDSDGEETSRQSLPDKLDISMIERVAEEFVGAIDQIPPMYSAIKIDGQRLYKLAREGIEVERAARRVQIFSIDVLHQEDDLAVLKVRCSKGTYIRTLVEDIGAKLGCGAHVDSLRRLSVTPFAESSMITEDALKLTAENGFAALEECLLPIDHALKHLERIEVRNSFGAIFRQGQAVPVSAVVRATGMMPGRNSESDSNSGQLIRIYCDDEFIGIGGSSGDVIKPVRVFNC